MAGRAARLVSRITCPDAEYFNRNVKEARITHTDRKTRFVTSEQCRHAFEVMPDATDMDRRNKALFAFKLLTEARDGAATTLRLKRIDLAQGCVHQDARDVKTRFAKTFITTFFPVGPIDLACFDA